MSTNFIEYKQLFALVITFAFLTTVPILYLPPETPTARQGWPKLDYITVTMGKHVMICLTSLFFWESLKFISFKNAIKAVSQRDYPFFPTDLNSTILNRAL